jgi:hypothetical protein
MENHMAWGVYISFQRALTVTAGRQRRFSMASLLVARETDPGCSRTQTPRHVILRSVSYVRTSIQVHTIMFKACRSSG